MEASVRSPSRPGTDCGADGTPRSSQGCSNLKPGRYEARTLLNRNHHDLIYYITAHFRMVST